MCTTKATCLHKLSKRSTVLICISISISPSVSPCGFRRPVFQISISVPLGGHDTIILNITLVGFFHSWNCSWRYLEPSVWSWKGKTQRCWIGHLKAVIRTLILRSAEPRQLCRRVFSSHPTPSPSSCFPSQQSSPPSLCLPDSQRSDVHQHDLPDGDQFSHFQWERCFQEHSSKRRVSVMTNSSLTRRSGGDFGGSVAHGVIFTQQFCHTKMLLSGGNPKMTKVFNSNWKKFRLMRHYTKIDFNWEQKEIDSSWCGVFEH